MAIGGSKMRTMAAMQQPNRQGGAMPMPEVAPAVKGRSAMTGGRAFGNRSAFGVAKQRPVAPAVPAAKPTAPANMRPRTQPTFNDAQLQQLQQEKVLREQQNQRYLSNPAAMAQLAQAPNNLARLSPTPTNATSTPFTPQKVTDPAIRQALLNAPKPPAMRKGGAVKKKPGYAKGGMVMANCGASMKPQQKAKK